MDQDFKKLKNKVFKDDRGVLSVLDNLSVSAFAIERVYYISKTKADVPRGFHAHRKAKQVFTCIAGGFTIYLDDGKEIKEVSLQEHGESLMIDKPTWLKYVPVSDNSILLVLSDTKHDKSEYITDYNEFLQLRNNYGIDD